MLRSRWSSQPRQPAGGGSPDRARDSDPDPFWPDGVVAQPAGLCLRAFLQTEFGSAGVLLAATAAALVWANPLPRPTTRHGAALTIRLGEVGLTSLSLREWLTAA